MRDHASDDADADFVRGAQAKPLFAKAPAEVRTPPLDLLFIADRTPATSPDEPEPYTADRSRLMAYRSTTILFGEHTTWDALVKQSLLVERSTSSDLKLGPTKELGRYPRIPCAVAVTPEGLTRAPATVDAHETGDRTLQAEIARRLPLSPRKEMVLYIHGVKNTFSDAAFTMGEICHFLGTRVRLRDVHLARGRKARDPVRLPGRLRIEHIRGRALAEAEAKDGAGAPD